MMRARASIAMLALSAAVVMQIDVSRPRIVVADDVEPPPQRRRIVRLPPPQPIDIAEAKLEAARLKRERKGDRLADLKAKGAIL